jgi:hypothetical protein
MTQLKLEMGRVDGVDLLKKFSCLCWPLAPQQRCGRCEFSAQIYFSTLSNIERQITARLV